MAVLLKKLLWYPQDEPTKPVNLTGAIAFTAAKGLDIKNNVFSFQLKNTENRLNSDGLFLYTNVTAGFNLRLREDDVIKLWLHYSEDFAEIEDSSWSNNTEEPNDIYLRGSYVILDIQGTTSGSGSRIKVSCADRTYVLFNRLLAKDFPLTTVTGTTTSTVSNKLIDNTANFTNSETVNVGMTVTNTTDNTSSRIVSIDSATQLTLANDIFVSGENYSLQWNAPSILQKVIRFASQNSKGNFTGTGNDSGVLYSVDAKLEDAEGGFIQDYRKNTFEDGTTNTDLFFPAKSIAKVWKAVYEWVDDLSQIEYLNSLQELENSDGKKLVYGRRFIYWVDQNNQFHWKSTTNTIQETITMGTTPNVYSYDIGDNGSEVINFVVFRGGEDFYGNGTLDYVIDTSINTTTKKMHVIAMTDIANTLIEKEIAIGNLLVNTSGSFTFSGNRYNRNGSVVAHWNQQTYSSDSNYNSALRAEIIRIGKNRSRAFISGRGSTRLKGKIDVRGALYSAGDLFTITNRSVGHNEELLRLTEVRDQINANGWFTTLELEQDDEVLIQLG
jgi:hypothetical protein